MEWKIIVPIVLSILTGIGYFLKGYVDQYFKNRDKRIEDHNTAVEALSPVITAFNRLSDNLCSENYSSSEFTLDGHIKMRQERLQNMVELQTNIHNSSRQYTHFLAKESSQRITELNSVLSIALSKMSNDYDAAYQFMEDGDEVLRVINCGIKDYCIKYKSDIHPLILLIVDDFRKRK